MRSPRRLSVRWRALRRAFFRYPAIAEGLGYLALALLVGRIGWLEPLLAALLGGLAGLRVAYLLGVQRGRERARFERPREMMRRTRLEVVR